MRYKLKHELNERFSTIEQILYNRNVLPEHFSTYLNSSDDVIFAPVCLGPELLRKATTYLIKAISNDDDVMIVVDSDCDGWTSAALLINYLHDWFPAWTENHLFWALHSGKQHGLTDERIMQDILDIHPALVIVPDAGSNDFAQHTILKQEDINVIILDHHQIDIDIDPTIYQDAVIINNQLAPQYPNKSFSGVGVTWQFCRYIDQVMEDYHFADKYVDLVALGNCGDMMSMLSMETKHLINKGFREEHLENPFIIYMADKNSYSLGSEITPMGAAFYIVPFINAVVRSGTEEEQVTVFNSMVNHFAMEKIPSNKRGHKPDEMELLVQQAVRTAVNVKARQTKAQDKGMEILEQMIERDNLLDHKVLLFKLEKGTIEPNIAGLCANKIMAKYQRPVCVLIHTQFKETVPAGPQCPFNEDIVVDTYSGSARGCDIAGITDFKLICEQTKLPRYATGHAAAFGLSLRVEDIDKFLELTDEALKDMSNEPIYYVDYIFDGKKIDPQVIIDIAGMNHLWGKDMEEPYIAIKGLKITKDMIAIMGEKKNTLKITIGDVSLIKFNSSEDEYNELYSEMGFVEIDVVGRCAINDWGGEQRPQVKIEDYQIVDKARYLF